MKPTRTANLPWRMIDSRAVIVQPRNGKVHELNPAAALLWESADGSRTLEVIAERLMERFEVDCAQALGDARAFYAELGTHGLIFWEP